MAEIVRTTLTDHRKKAVNVQLVTEALLRPRGAMSPVGLGLLPRRRSEHLGSGI